MNTSGPGICGYVLLMIVQILFLILYAVFVRYDNSILPIDMKENGDLEEEEKKVLGSKAEHVPSYSHFQDIHVMIFVGFAFLMTFLKKIWIQCNGIQFIFCRHDCTVGYLHKGYL